jgi:hypothetical protein
MNNMYPTSRHSGFTRPAHETCSAGSASSEESTQQLSSSLLTSDASEEMNPSTPLAGSSNTGNTSPTERLGNQMVLVERAPEPLPSSQNIPLHPSPPHRQHPMSPASVVWTPVLIPAAPYLINARSGQVSVVRDLDRHILVID